MMRTILLCTLAIILVKYLNAQETLSIGFEKKSIELSRSINDTVIVPIHIITANTRSSSWKEYTIGIHVNYEKTSLPRTEYQIDFFQRPINKLEESEFAYIHLRNDSLGDRERKLYLLIQIDSAGMKRDLLNTARYKEIEITIKELTPKKGPLQEYTYLSYLGTNFDLVDGIRAQNLFFASNIYFPPYKNYNKVGLFLSLYGNRAMSDTDSTGNAIRTSRLRPLTDSTYMRYTEQIKMITTRYSDNIGAYISPLFRIFPKNEKTDLKLYFSPSLEFVWRRTNILQTFKDPVSQDSVVISGQIPAMITMDNTLRRNFNEYSFNLGLISLFLVIENKSISTRVYASVGYSSSFYPKISYDSNLTTSERSSDVFFSGKAWITEPTTGLTLQAEVLNTYYTPRPFFGATLSKAFNIGELSGFFSPIVSRK